MELALDERIIQELRQIRTELEDAGKLPSVQQLEGYYATFRNKFAHQSTKSVPA
jgi:hypothetical protein